VTDYAAHSATSIRNGLAQSETVEKLRNISLGAPVWFIRCYHQNQRPNSMRYTIILEQEADGGYVATVPALPGCVSQGDTRDEVMRNIREAADLYIEDCIAAGDPVPTEAGREYFELQTGTRQ
jgi:predicted RNase H-like HicB family nuclease